jgi:hypothetical protein
VDLGGLIGAILGRDSRRARSERQHDRDQMSVALMSAVWKEHMTIRR